MPNTREAFALRRCENNFQQILVCLACLVIEASTDKPLDRRINTFRLQMVDGLVVNPELGPRDVSTYYSEATFLDCQEKQAGLVFREAVLKYPENTVVVWISPPGGDLKYQEGRIVVGVNKKEYMDVYGICTNFSASECLDIGKKLAEPHQDILQDPEQLRDTAFILSNLPQDPWQELNSRIPLPEVWDTIAAGETQKNNHQVWQDARAAIGALWPFLKNLKPGWGQIVAGALLEKLMLGRGHNIAAGVCGDLNSDLIGQPVTIGGELGKFVRNCGKCGRRINQIISKGYQCKNPMCLGIYAGC